MTHLWTLTNEGEVRDPRVMVDKIGSFLRAMREAGWAIPIVLVMEPHPGGHGYHVHFAAPRFIRIALVRAWWGPGVVDVRGPKVRPRGHWSPRKLASYLAKYLTKDLTPAQLAGCSPRPPGMHRYWKPQGHELVPVRASWSTVAEFLAWVRAAYGKWDAMHKFGEGEPFRPFGFWLTFPDACCRAPPASSLV